MSNTKSNLEALTNKLKKNRIRVSHQRLKVLEYLDNHRVHPTVEQIYHGIRQEVPSLSKTTIYNTLDTLIDAGLVRSINIEDNEVRYDIRTDSHGHFKCKSCGEVYDFEVNTDSFEVKGLDEFKVLTRDIYFSGLCSRCAEKVNETGN